MLGLVTPHLIGIERHRHEHPVAGAADEVVENRCGDATDRSSHDERRGAAEEVAVPAGRRFEGRHVGGRQRAVRTQLERDSVGGHGALHRRHELGVDEGHAGGRLTCPRHDARAIEHPPGFLVPAVRLVQDLQQVAGGHAARRRRIGGRVPERAPVVLERLEPVSHLRQTGAHITEWERGPVGQVALGRRAVTGEVAQGQLSECLAAVETARGRNPIGEQGVGVRAVGGGTAAADQCLQFELGEEDRQRVGLEVEARVGEDGRQVCSGQVGRRSASSTALDARSTARSSIPCTVRSCGWVDRRTRGAVSSINHATSSAAT